MLEINDEEIYYPILSRLAVAMERYVPRFALVTSGLIPEKDGYLNDIYEVLDELRANGFFDKSEVESGY